MPATPTSTAKKPTPQPQTSKPAPAASSPPQAAPAAAGSQPPAPAATPPKSFPGLDEDLAQFATPSAKPAPDAAPAKTDADKSAPDGDDTAVSASDTAKAKSDAAQAATGDADDYLMGPAAEPSKPSTASTEDAAAKPETATGPLKAPELRAEYARVKQRNQALEKELAELKSKPAETKVDDSERKAFVDEISGLKKQVDDMTSALKVVAYEQSPEYREKYETPFVDAWNEGVQLVTGLTVNDQEGNTRKGTAEDFQEIMREPVNERAAELANEMFGANAFYVLAQRRDIMKLHQRRVKALEDHKQNLSQYEKAQSEQVKKQQEEQESRRIQDIALFKKLNAEAIEKYPEIFAPIPGDDQGNSILEKGFKDADLAFSGAPNLTAEKRVKLHSAIRNRAAAFGRLVYQLKQKDAKIQELQKQLEEINGSTPGPGQQGRADGDKPRQLTADEEIELAATQDR